MLAGGPQVVYGATSSDPTVYYYQDPRTGQRVASLLPPDHPQMVCLQSGSHVPETRYGCLGASCSFSFFFFFMRHSIAALWRFYVYFSRRARGNHMVPAWDCLMSARSSCAMRTLWGDARGWALQLNPVPGPPSLSFFSFLLFFFFLFLVASCPTRY
jgi:hypothetical protein